MDVTVYECRNLSCSLGSRKDYGRFSGGASQQLVMTITGDPNAEYGDGVCPVCAEPGVEVGTETLAQGQDPNQPIHDEIAARVENPNDELDKDNSQAALHAMVGSEA